MQGENLSCTNADRDVSDLLMPLIGFPVHAGSACSSKRSVKSAASGFVSRRDALLATSSAVIGAAVPAVRYILQIVCLIRSRWFVLLLVVLTDVESCGNSQRLNAHLHSNSPLPFFSVESHLPGRPLLC